MLRAAGLKWEFEQINFVVVSRGSVVETHFFIELKKLDVAEGIKNKLFADHVTQEYEAHNRMIVSFVQHVQGFARSAIKGSRENIGHNDDDVVECARVRRCREEHTLTDSEHQSWGPSNDRGITGMVKWESQSKTSPESGRRTHLLYFTYSYCILSRVQKLFSSDKMNLSLHCLFYVTINIYFCFYFNIANNVVTVLLIFLDIYHFNYTFSHAHIEAHTHKHTCMISTQEEWRQLDTGAWLEGAEESVLIGTRPKNQKNVNTPISQI